MGFLAKRLRFEPDDRLVQVAVHPALDALTGAPSTVYVHKVRLSEDDDPAAYAGALTAFVPGVVATFSVVSPEWFETQAILFQVVEEDDHDVQVPALGGPELKFSAPGDSVERACRLLGITTRPDHRVMTWILSDRLLRHKFGRVREYVAGWEASDLVLALLVELATGRSRKDLAIEALVLDEVTDGDVDERRRYFHSLLLGWSSTYDGPEVPA